MDDDFGDELQLYQGLMTDTLYAYNEAAAAMRTAKYFHTVHCVNIVLMCFLLLFLHMPGFLKIFLCLCFLIIFGSIEYCYYQEKCRFELVMKELDDYFT